MKRHFAKRVKPKPTCFICQAPVKNGCRSYCDDCKRKIKEKFGILQRQVYANALKQVIEEYKNSRNIKIKLNRVTQPNIHNLPLVRREKTMNDYNSIRDALAIIVQQLREDEDYYRGWKANIATAFQDTMENAGYKFPDLHKLANQAAENFLDNLMKISPSHKDKKTQHSQIEELLRSACAIAERRGKNTDWSGFVESVKKVGLNGITARTYRVVHSEKKGD